MIRINKEYIDLCTKEGWTVEEGRVYVDDLEFTISHPYQIYLRIYRNTKDVNKKVHSMRKIHDMLWPQHIITYNSWTDRRFLAHCTGYSHIVMAGGAACGKSLDAAKIALIFWLSDPRHNACIIASTTLDSLESRIWGYAVKLINMAAIPIAASFFSSKPPKILYPGQKEKIHGMFATAIRSGTDETTLSTIIGRHPDKGLLVVLDEATDMPPSITKALPNLEQGVDSFQLIAIGNSNSRNDLHGALATPRKGWKTINPDKDFIWETQHKNGVCLYFSPFDSPAITEQDAAKKAELSRFLITEAGIAAKKKEYGEGTDSYARFVLGFWREKSLDTTAISGQFLTENQVQSSAEWSGFYGKEVVAGLDPAFQTGTGDKCTLRLAVYGHTVSGLIALDYRKEELTFKISVSNKTKVSGERQIAEQVCDILRRYNCPISNLAIDASGIGRALGELIRLLSGQEEQPFRIVSVGHRRTNIGKNLEKCIVTISPSEMWLKFREFVQNKQIKGLDAVTIGQLTNRLLFNKNDKLVLEPKADYKSRMSAINPALARSPDEADACILVTQAAIMRFGFTPGATWGFPTSMSGSTFMMEKELAYMSQQQVDRQLIIRPPLVPNFASTLEDAITLSPHSNLLRR